MIEVVSAILVRHDRIFLQQRPVSKDFGFCWESPGGKVDKNENHLNALRRELAEEIGVDVGELPHDLRPAWTGDFSNVVTRLDRASVRLHFYMIGDRFTGTPVAKEGQPGMGLFSVDEMFCLDLAPANHRAQFAIAKAIRGRS